MTNFLWLLFFQRAGDMVGDKNLLFGVNEKTTSVIFSYCNKDFVSEKVHIESKRQKVNRYKTQEVLCLLHHPIKQEGKNLNWYRKNPSNESVI